ncbi:restriction endonuclease subunit S [Methylobacter sp. Wu1]|uniref:restriction endonuclease subunit S n=1 Tax=Methylobacter sp. Wu1 TaxID=3119359 RepID=UPI002F9270E4
MTASNQLAEASASYLAGVAAPAEPAGYKNTEVGIIPSDWDVLPMSKLTNLMTNGFVGIAKTHYTDSHEGITYIQGYNVEENGFNFNGIKKVTPEFHKKNIKSCLRSGDILMVQTGDVGLVTIVPPELEGSNCHALIINRFKPNYDPKYFAYLLNSSLVRLRLKELETGTTMKHINVGDLLHFEVPFPKGKEEQTAIANALSDADALVSELEKLIAKKQAIKTATMQQLLTGRTRLPQFALHEDSAPKGYKQSELGEIPEDWDCIHFSNLFGAILTRKTLKLSDTVSFVGMQDVTENAQLSNTTLIKFSDIKSGFTYFEKGDVLVAKITPCFENGKGCHTDSLPTQVGYGSTEFHVLRAKENSDARFIYFWTTRNSFRIALESEMVGSAGHRRVPFSAIQKYLIPSPKNKEEQTAIAAILSNMDAEIQALQKRLVKTRQIKQGMMQELLTGKTRLVKPAQKEVRECLS